MNRSPAADRGRFRTPAAVVLADLMDRCAQWAELDDPTMISGLVAEALLDAPEIWPLDDFMLEALLETAGFRLSEVDHLDTAVSLLCFLHGNGLTPVECGHGKDQTPLCERGGRLEDDDAFTSATAMSAARHHLARDRRAIRSAEARRIAAGDP